MSKRKTISIISIIIASIIIIYTYIIPISYLTIRYKKPFVGCITIFYWPERYGLDLNYFDCRWKDAEWAMLYGDNVFGVSAEGISLINKEKISFTDDYQDKQLCEWVVEDLQQNVNENIIYADHLACHCGGFEEANREYPDIWTKENCIESLGCYDPCIYLYCEDLSDYILGDVTEYYYCYNDYIDDNQVTQKCIETKRSISKKIKKLYGAHSVQFKITNSKIIRKEQMLDSYKSDTIVLNLSNVDLTYEIEN